MLTQLVVHHAKRVQTVKLPTLVVEYVQICLITSIQIMYVLLVRTKWHLGVVIAKLGNLHPELIKPNVWIVLRDTKEKM